MEEKNKEENNKIKEERSKKEERVRAITRIYYSNPRVLEAMAKFSQDREVVPRYFESFGKRPDKIQYPSDIMGLVNKGATSFHASEEIWNDPLLLNSEISSEEMNRLRKSWDLLIDIDSPYLDLSKEAAKLVIETLERYGIKNYGLKYSGSKGFHIILSGKAFPKEFDGFKTKEIFPEWARAITEFIFSEIKQEFRRRVGKLMSFKHLDKENQIRIYCTQCKNIAEKAEMAKLRCSICSLEVERRGEGKNKLRCMNANCRGLLEIIGTKEYYYCKNCMDTDNNKLSLSSNKYPELFKEIEGELADEYAELDLVLVAPRHLFRMPYSLHEKTALASVVMTKNQIDSFSPQDANPLKVKIVNYLPESEEGEAKNLLAAALEWKKTDRESEEKVYKKYENFEKIDIKGVTEEMFPKPIKKLLLGLKEGKKRGLFILITFLRSINFPPDYINQKAREWNKLNEPPLREGYLKSQIDWLFRQKRNILPPNYSNKNFYKDLGLIDETPEAKNPISELVKRIRMRR
ncbi:hypothetical protein J4229_02255 [Candidatus Pacearchaeota archaeon]|nr:hypothetical protein [Candidatus Pacearchaeota archaeon]